MINRTKTTIFFTILVVTHLLLSYYYFGKWWNASLGTLLIVGICYINWRKDFLQFSGLKVKMINVVVSVLLTGVIILISFSFIHYVALRQQIRIEFAGWKNLCHNVFYILNEEIVFGSVILFSLIRSKNVKPLAASIGLAFIFSTGHFIFYKWIFLDKGILEISTLCTLFFIAVVRNNIILYTGHIAYSWSLHFGWMFVMFGCNHIDVYTNTSMSELTRFNMYLGTTTMVVVSFLMAVGSLYLMLENRRNDAVILHSDH
ncbi:hypothetical protein OU798_07780 [Prolixibacteraceae bacterium Z1-6]|uniref:Uncharacterized protein n=1 Tax=Draconibacterium aestuarii TaxID=2998507 RepID=A0A9X3J5B3_9BACT|nr:hypothetical protein [Prolixibacteraceae bacterium Z1-6]